MAMEVEKRARKSLCEPYCFYCRHLGAYPNCAAFPKGIPEKIRLGKVLHTSSIQGDNGIVFEPRKDVGRQAAAEASPPIFQGDLEESVALALQNYRSGLIDADDLVAFLLPTRLEENGRLD